MNTKIMEGLVGATTNMRQTDTTMRVFRDARRRGDLDVMERAMEYTGDYTQKAGEYQEKAQEGMEEEAQEVREKMKAQMAEAIQNRSRRSRMRSLRRQRRRSSRQILWRSARRGRPCCWITWGCLRGRHSRGQEPIPEPAVEAGARTGAPGSL